VYKTSLPPANIANIELTMQKVPVSEGEASFMAAYIAVLNQCIERINSAKEIAKNMSPG
jgi:hypothetical protein